MLGHRSHHLRNQLDDTADLLDLLLSQSRDPARLHNHGQLGETALTEDLAVARGESVNDGDFRRLGGHAAAQVSGHKGPELVQVDNRLVLGVAQQVVVAHTDLTEVTRVVLVEVGTVVVETTGQTATTGVLAVLADTTVTCRNVTTVLPSLSEMGRHLFMLASFFQERAPGKRQAKHPVNPHGQGPWTYHLPGHGMRTLR